MTAAAYYFDDKKFVRNDEQIVLYLTNGISKVIEYFNAIISPRIAYSFVENEISLKPVYIHDKNVTIDCLTTDKYFLRKPISVAIEVNANDDEYIAEFKDAEIAFSGRTASGSVRELEIELIEVYELYKAEKCLGAWPKHQLAVLESYIGEKKV